MVKTVSKVLQHIDPIKLPDYHARLWFLWLKPDTKTWTDVLPAHLSPDARDIIEALAKRDQVKPELGSQISFDQHPLQRWVFVVVSAEFDTFGWLSEARKILKPLREHGCRVFLADLTDLPGASALQAADALTAAAKTLQFEFPKYAEQSSRKKQVEESELDLLVRLDLDLSEVERLVQWAEHSGAANNQLRHLVMQAGNDLTPHNYVATLKTLAEQSQLGFQFINQKKLQTMGAGAFLAVAQGSDHEDAGIVKLSYQGHASRQSKHLVIVGKGVTFDTGGHNLKSPSSMLGMHRDMAGSAVAYSLMALAAKERWPIRMTAYLAIAENAIGPKAYRQNDVVKSMSGKTIEIVDTDAEGRMLLADTLHLASMEKPDLLIDFATLTGACIRALSTVYSGVFTNRPEWLQVLIDAGRESGERVWPFPIDADFKECLKSDIADLKQCRVSGGVDHIEAALFLQEFIGKGIPWVHVDLSAAENEGGLAHIDTEVTGFGLRFVSKFLSLVWKGLV